MAWTGVPCQHHAFIVEDFIRNGEYVTRTLRNFKTHFKLNRNDPGPNRKSVMLWVKNFKATGSAVSTNSKATWKASRAPSTSRGHHLQDEIIKTYLHQMITFWLWDETIHVLNAYKLCPFFLVWNVVGFSDPPCTSFNLRLWFLFAHHRLRL